MISTLRQEFLRWLRWARRAPPGLWLRVRRRLGCCGCPWPAPHRVGGRGRRGEAQEGPTERAAHRGVCGISNQVGKKQEFRSASQVHSQKFLALVKGHEKPKVVPFPSSDHKKHHNHRFLFCAQCPFTSNYWLLGGGDNPRHVPWNGVLHIFWGLRSYSWGVSWSLWSCAHIIYVYLEPKWPLFLKVNPPQNKALSNENRGHLGSRWKLPCPPTLWMAVFLSCYFFRKGLPNRWLPDFTVQKVIHDEVAIMITRADQNWNINTEGWNTTL